MRNKVDTMRIFALRSFLNLLGAINVGNGLWMLFYATSWYENIPAAVHETGPLNVHFVHDIGLVYLLAGIALLWCAHEFSQIFKIYLAVLLFYIGHSCIHMAEIVLGQLPSSRWLVDFPLVFLPTIILIGLTPFILKIDRWE